jgi:hypothetical protein
MFLLICRSKIHLCAKMYTRMCELIASKNFKYLSFERLNYDDAAFFTCLEYFVLLISGSIANAMAPSGNQIKFVAVCAISANAFPVSASILKSSKLWITKKCHAPMPACIGRRKAMEASPKVNMAASNPRLEVAGRANRSTYNISNHKTYISMD